MTQERAVELAKELLSHYSGDPLDTEAVAMWVAGGILAVEKKTATDCAEIVYSEWDRQAAARKIIERYGTMK